jgi:hypothetical protein
MVGSPIKEFWEYDPTANVWTRKADYVGQMQFDGKGFSIGNKGYFGFSSYSGEFREYDPVANNWTRKADFPLSVSTCFLW